MDFDLENDVRLRVLGAADADLVVEATHAEPGRSLWGEHRGPYSAEEARTALAEWDRSAGGQFSLGIFDGERLLGAVGLIPEGPGGIEVAYWLRPEARGKGHASRAVQAATRWARRELGVPRLWLEIKPGNDASVKVAERAGYRFEERLPQHCREWTNPDPALDTRHDCLIYVHPGEDVTPPPA